MVKASESIDAAKHVGVFARYAGPWFVPIMLSMVLLVVVVRLGDRWTGADERTYQAKHNSQHKLEWENHTHFAKDEMAKQDSDRKNIEEIKRSMAIIETQITYLTKELGEVKDLIHKQNGSSK